MEQSLDTTIDCFHQKAMFLEIAYMRGFFHTINRCNDKNQIYASKSKFSVDSEYLTIIAITSSISSCVPIFQHHFHRFFKIRIFEQT